MKHLRFSNLPADEQSCALKEIVRSYPLLMDVMARLRNLELKDHWIVSGAIYNNVWNYLTERPFMTGVKDIDVFYFDDGDLSYEAEDRVIKRVDKVCAGIEPPIEVRNQARVHLWYKDHFGEEYTPLKSSREGIDRFASITHAVAMRLNVNDEIELYAPHGLNEIFSFRITPNYLLNNEDTHLEKGRRALKSWPELTIVPWEQPTSQSQVKRQAS